VLEVVDVEPVPEDVLDVLLVEGDVVHVVVAELLVSEFDVAEPVEVVEVVLPLFSERVTCGDCL
jgi:hypothetical protein